MVQRNANLVDLENPEKMRLLSLSEVSIQPRTSPPKFLKNRGVRMGVSGGMFALNATRMFRHDPTAFLGDADPIDVVVIVVGQRSVIVVITDHVTAAHSAVYH